MPPREVRKPRDHEWSPYYRQGQRAFREGKKLSECPYFVSATGKSWHVEAWRQGWYMAEKGIFT